MAIDPLQSYYPSTEFSGSGTAKKSISGSTAFETALGALSKPANGNSATTVQLAAADLFRIQMMQSSLSLCGDRENQGSAPLPALEALLAGPTLSRPTAVASAPIASAPIAVAQAAPASHPATDISAEDPGAGEIEATAARYLGTPYRFGGEGADGIDCSSFVQKVFRENQIELPRTAREQIRVGTEVAPQDLRKGDLVFFQTYASYPSHVGIYLGNGKMIHASSSKGEVAISDLNSDFYRSRFLGAKRVVGSV